MKRKVTANRTRLNIRQRVAVDAAGFVYVDAVKIARYDAAAGTLQFSQRRADRNAGEVRMVEVQLLDLVQALREAVSSTAAR